MVLIQAGTQKLNSEVRDQIWHQEVQVKQSQRELQVLLARDWSHTLHPGG